MKISANSPLDNTLVYLDRLSMGFKTDYKLCGNCYLHSQYFTFLLDFYSIRIYPTGRIGH